MYLTSRLHTARSCVCSRRTPYQPYAFLFHVIFDFLSIHRCSIWPAPLPRPLYFQIHHSCSHVVLVSSLYMTNRINFFSCTFLDILSLSSSLWFFLFSYRTRWLLHAPTSTFSLCWFEVNGVSVEIATWLISLFAASTTCLLLFILLYTATAIIIRHVLQEPSCKYFHFSTLKCTSHRLYHAVNLCKSFSAPFPPLVVTSEYSSVSSANFSTFNVILSSISMM